MIESTLSGITMNEPLPYAVNFKLKDFKCKCATCQAMIDVVPATKPHVIMALQKIRDLLKEPMFVARGVSCTAHNASVGGAPDSRHLPEHADAVDILSEDPQQAYRIVALAIALQDFTAIRVYQHHVHLDMRPGKPIFIASPE